MGTRRVVVKVSDRGDWNPDHRNTDLGPYRGQGFAVMSACTAELHLQRSSEGTTVILVSTDVPAR